MKFLQTTAGLVFFGALALSLPTHAGGGVSGGGNVLACKTDEGTETYQLLDYFDSTKQGGFGFELDLGPGKTYPEKIKYVLGRMSKFDGHRSQKFAIEAKSFLEMSEFSDLPKATDSNDLGGGYILPDHCEIRRVIILRSDEEQTVSGNKARFSIVRPVWDQLDDTTIAGLILHEIAYLEAIEKGALTSLAIRRFIAFISSKNIATEDYSVEVARAGLLTWGGQRDFTSQPVPPYGNPGGEDYALEHDLNHIKLSGAHGIKRRAALDTLFDVTIDRQKLKCRKIGLWVADPKFTISPLRMLHLYQKLISKETSLLAKDIFENDLSMDLFCSGQLSVKSPPQSKIDYEMIIEASNDGHFSFHSNKTDGHLDGVYKVVKGHYNGEDVSGYTCKTNPYIPDPRRVVCAP
ncbi:MAG: hypothetical protein JNM39_00600 [Bdellovibrionaceae bacterium]|nr:hypothetical protein [Pseudobdellovibrionaceae bacterium]